MVQASNLESAMQQWKERSRRFEKLFDPKVTNHRDFQRENLKYLDTLRVKVKAGIIKDDTQALQGLTVERKRIARELYPNLIVRLLESLLSTRRIDQRAVKVNTHLESNMQAVGTELDKLGLSSIRRQVEQQMKQGSNEISVPVSYQVSETEKMKLEVRLIKDDAGTYTLDQAKALLFKDGARQPAQHTFEVGKEDSFQMDTAFNLLAGRAVYSRNSHGWQQLDFNDRDADGNFRVKHIPQQYGFDIEKAIAALGIVEKDKEVLLEKLRNGELVTVRMQLSKKEETVRIAADPVRREVALYTEAGAKIDLKNMEQSGSQQKNAAKVQQLVPKENQQTPQGKAKALKF